MISILLPSLHWDLLVVPWALELHLEILSCPIERVSPLVVIGLALLGCYCFGVLVWTGSLLVDQAGLIARNETSIERVKKTWRGRQNPHDRGAFRNWLDFLFRATPSVVLELDQVESRCEAA